jgi:hypothetical protein
MEPESSLPCSQEPSTGPYPKPDQSSPYHPILSKIQFNIVHPSTSYGTSGIYQKPVLVLPLEHYFHPPLTEKLPQVYNISNKYVQEKLIQKYKFKRIKILSYVWVWL